MLSDYKTRQAKIVEGAKAILRTRKYELVNIVDKEEYIDLLGEKKQEGEKAQKIIIRVPANDPVGVSVLREFKEYIEKKKYNAAILLALRKYTHYTKKEAAAASIETFSDRFPFFDLFEHEMVPLHEFASQEEIDTILSKFSITLKQLPKISVFDPAVQMLGGKVDNVIKITRDSLTAGKFAVYRFVIS